MAGVLARRRISAISLLAFVAMAPCVGTADGEGREVALLCASVSTDGQQPPPIRSGQVVTLSAAPKGCVSSSLRVNRAPELRKAGERSWILAGDFHLQGHPPLLPDCGGGTARWTLGKLGAGRYEVRAGALTLGFEVAPASAPASSEAMLPLCVGSK
jgi:hypothetical protein